MAAPVVGPCEPWTSAEDLEACCGTEIPPNADFPAAVDYASQVMFGLSGRQFPGACERVLRPCHPQNNGCGALRPGWSWWWGYPSVPFRDESGWHNIGACDRECNIDCIRLPWPVNEVTEILIDGLVMNPADYAVDSFREVCRLDGNSWPCSQNFALDVTEVGTWQITVIHGKPITAAMNVMATKLGCQFLKAMCGAESCLPDNVKTIARIGTAIDFEETGQLFTDGQTGIREIDLWLRVVNPRGIQRPASVHRADDPRRMRRWT